jgi:hypothetical protein
VVFLGLKPEPSHDGRIQVKTPPRATREKWLVHYNAVQSQRAGGEEVMAWPHFTSF